MLSILENISPVFLVILLGFGSRRLGFLPDLFISSANRLVYFVAIPILVYDEISRGSFSSTFDMYQILPGSAPALWLTSNFAFVPGDCPFAAPGAPIAYAN